MWGTKKIKSCVIVTSMITAGFLLAVPINMPNVAALYVTPGGGAFIGDMDDLVAISGGAVTGGSGLYTFNEDVRISAGDILNVLPGDVCSFDLVTSPPMPPFTLEVQGSIYALGDVAGITFTSAEASPAPRDWSVIFINGGYGQFENVTIEYSQFGIYIYNTAGTDIVSNCTFRYNSDTGLMYWQVGGNPEVKDCIFANSGQTAALYIGDTSLRVNNNVIYGWNATPGSGLPGGPAIYATTLVGPAPPWTTTVWNNRIIGGNGDVNQDGGHAIWVDDFEGSVAGLPQVMINNNWNIKGGNGGVNTADGGNAGVGGMGIYFNGVPDIGDPSTDNSAIKIIDNLEIIGGNGGDNNAANDGSSGLGGTGVYIYDDDMTGSVNISGNTYIKGGDGGDSSATDTGINNWLVGNGSNAITLDWLHNLVPTIVSNNNDVIGGKGGNTTGNGNFGTAGFGGNGIWSWGSTDTSIETSNIVGGHGGNNTGTIIMGGDGGDGVRLEPKGPFWSVATLTNVVSTGGEGGDDYTGMAGPIAQGPGSGGDGLAVLGDTAFTSGSASSSNFAGGKGGDIFADNNWGGMGGYGIHARNTGSVSVMGGTIIGGTGGDNRFAGPFNLGSQGGLGGYGVSLEPAGTSGFFDGVTLISGGDGGDSLFDPFGSPGFGFSGFFAIQSDSVTVMNSEIVPGYGGYDWVDMVYGGNGEYGVEIYNVANPINIEGNTVHEARWAGIRVNQCNGNIDNNEVFNGSNKGIELTGLSPALYSNYVHNNDFIGINTRLNSDPTISRCTIDDSGTYAFYIESNSDPFVLNSTISGSGTADWYVDGDSHPTSLNTTNDKTVVINDALSDLTMQWFMHTQVVDQFFTPVAGAEVWINDTFGTNILNDFTPANDWLNWTVVTEFVETQAARTYYTDHNATAISGLQQGWATPEPTMDASREVIIVLGAASYNIFLDQGWNLISVPLIQADESIDEVLRTIDGQWDKIMIYDALDPTPWKSNCTFWPPSLNEFDTLNHTQGFWIRITSASATLTVTGTEPVTTNIPLYAGWNLVGYPSFMEKTISNALAGTGYDEPVEGWDPAAPYGLTPLADSYMMKPGEAYWVHVPTDTIWVVDNPTGVTDPYSIYGYVYLYDGTSAGGYSPLLSGAGSTVDVTWWDPSNGWQTSNTVTNAAGQYSVSLFNYTDGSEVYVNATFAGFGNNGYNYTYVDTIGFPGGRQQDVVCGVPYNVTITYPLPLSVKISGVPFPAEWNITDIDGVICQGYFTTSGINDPFSWLSTDPMFVAPSATIWDGTATVTGPGIRGPGQGEDTLILYIGPLQWINNTEGGAESPSPDNYLTPWGEFYIDPFNTIPGWLKDYDEIILQVM